MAAAGLAAAAAAAAACHHSASASPRGGGDPRSAAVGSAPGLLCAQRAPCSTQVTCPVIRSACCTQLRGACSAAQHAHLALATPLLLLVRARHAHVCACCLQLIGAACCLKLCCCTLNTQATKCGRGSRLSSDLCPAAAIVGRQCNLPLPRNLVRRSLARPKAPDCVYGVVDGVVSGSGSV